MPVKGDVVDLQSVYWFSGCAGRIWELIDGTKTISRIQEVINDEFNTICQDVLDDLHIFFSTIEQFQRDNRGGIIKSK